MASVCALTSGGPAWSRWVARTSVGSTAALFVFLLVLILSPSAAFAADAPTVIGLSIDSGPAVGGATVIVTGTGFTGLSGTAAVSFGGTDAASYTVDSPTQITAVTPVHAVGKVDVRVTAEGLTSADTGADDYTFLTRYDQTDARLIYGGTWAPFSTASAWKGSYSRAATAGAAVTIWFNGTRLDWLAMKGTTTGSADVYLDDVYQATIDLAGAVPAYQQKVWSTGAVGSGTHHVRIVRNAASASGKYVTIDAVDVLGSVIDSPRVEQSDSRIAYGGGTWATYNTAGASAGSYARTSSSSGAAIIAFNGTKLTWVAVKGTTLGKAFVSVDGGAAVSVDLAAAAVAYQQKVWDTGTLSAGDHEVKIWYDASNASGKFISVDAVDLEGSLTKAYFTTRYEQDDPRFLNTGLWYVGTSASASAGNYKFGGTGTGITVNFTGARLDWIATFGPTMGIADVSVDGKAPVQIDLYSASTMYQKVAYTTGILTSGKHVVEITWDESNGASGAYFSVDAFDVVGSVPWELTLSASQALWVEQKLSDLTYRPGTIDGVFDTKTRGAIIAFQKWEGLTRNGEVSASVLNRLAAAVKPKPTYSGSTWIEVNKAKQVLLFCKDGVLQWTVPVSTGSASVGIVTPSGNKKVTRKTTETSPRYHPLYISTTLLAIHGYPNVPTYPASHGCVRTLYWDQDAIWPLAPVGTPVYVY